MGAPDPLAPAESLEIHDLATLKVMADPLRMRIIDLLRRRPATVKEIAGELNTPAKSLYYHVNMMERYGLIRVVETRVVSGIPEKRYRATAYLFNFSEARPCGDERPGVQEMETIESMFAITQDEIRVSAEGGLLDLRDPDAGLHLEWTLLDLSPDAFRDLSNRLEALLKEFRSEDRPLPMEQPCRMFTLLYPTYRRGERPEPPPTDTDSRRPDS